MSEHASGQRSAVSGQPAAPGKHAVTIAPDGSVSFLWDDELAGLRRLGETSIERASWVEPTGDGQWEADLSPVGGPLLGAFPLRRQALAAEREWLLAHWDQVQRELLDRHEGARRARRARTVRLHVIEKAREDHE